MTTMVAPGIAAKVAAAPPTTIGAAAALAIGNALASRRISGGTAHACGTESAPTAAARPALAVRFAALLPAPSPAARGALVPGSPPLRTIRGAGPPAQSVVLRLQRSDRRRGRRLHHPAARDAAQRLRRDP